MPRTFGSFEDLLDKLNAYYPYGWDGKLCIRTRIDDGRHQPTTHYYTRIFNPQISKRENKLKFVGPDDQEEPSSITFEDLRNEKFSIAVPGYGVGYDCSSDSQRWWHYEDTPQINSKGGKRRKTRRKRGKGGVFSRRRRVIPTERKKPME